MESKKRERFIILLLSGTGFMDIKALRLECKNWVTS